MQKKEEKKSVTLNPSPLPLACTGYMENRCQVSLCPERPTKEDFEGRLPGFLTLFFTGP